MLKITSIVPIISKKGELLKNNILNNVKLNAILKKYNVKGANIAVVNNLNIEYCNGVGECDDNKHTRVGKNTLFQVASISKPVFASALIKYVEITDLDLNKDVNFYLKDWKLTKKYNRIVSIKDLLSHNGGINVNGFNGYKANEEIPTTLEILNGRGNSPKIRSFIEGYSYSGGGYTILQYMVEQNFSNFPKFMRRFLFNEINMKHSKYFTQLNQKDMLASENYNIYPEFAAAGLYTTAHDIALLGIELQKSLLGYGKFTKKSVEDMLTSVNGQQHGLGFRISENNNIFWHGGINNTFYSRCVFTKDGKGFVILTNGNSQKAINEIAQYIEEQFNWHRFDYNYPKK